MESFVLDRLLAGKEARRTQLAGLPIEAKIRAVIQLQQLAEPIIRQRGRKVRCWPIDAPLIRSIP